MAIAEPSLDQLVPTEFRADLVLELCDATGKRVLAIVLEVQCNRDVEKEYAWPSYVVLVRAKRRCPTIALVVAANAELSILSALAHGNGPDGMNVILAALEGMKRLGSEHATVYFRIIWNALQSPMRHALEALIMEQQTNEEVGFPPFIQNLLDRSERRRGVLLRLLAKAGIALNEGERQRVQTCTDPDVLDRWIDNVLGAKVAADISSDRVRPLAASSPPGGPPESKRRRGPHLQPLTARSRVTR